MDRISNVRMSADRPNDDLMNNTKTTVSTSKHK